MTGSEAGTAEAVSCRHPGCTFRPRPGEEGCVHHGGGKPVRVRGRGRDGRDHGGGNQMRGRGRDGRGEWEEDVRIRLSWLVAGVWVLAGLALIGLLAGLAGGFVRFLEGG